MFKKYKAHVFCEVCEFHFSIHAGNPRVNKTVKTHCPHCKELRPAYIYKAEEK